MREAMSNASRRRRGFTLVEAVASIALVGIGVTSAMGGLAAMAKTDRQIQEREVLQRLAVQKYEELIATGQFETAELSGDFADRNIEEYEWAASVEPSGEENLEVITVTVNRVGDVEGPQASVDGLLFNPPIEGGAQ
jgi:prepilin-type N-terminal cleavage/methylation domain-containing protein